MTKRNFQLSYTGVYEGREYGFRKSFGSHEAAIDYAESCLNGRNSEQTLKISIVNKETKETVWNWER